MNLWDETIHTLNHYNKTWEDVKYIFGEDYQITPQAFKERAKLTEYDKGFGGQEIARDLEIWGNDFHMTRGEYDGSEWWEFHSHTPIVPIHLVTDCVNLKSKIGWDNLSDTNGDLEYWQKYDKVIDTDTKSYNKALEEDPSVNIVDDPLIGRIVIRRG